MSCLGVHFALTQKQVDELLAFDDDDSRLEHVQEVIEEEMVGAHDGWAYETDKSWDAIARSLGDEYPLSHAVFGGLPLYDGDDYIMSLTNPSQVRDVARALAALTKEKFREAYDRIDDALDFDYTWSNLEGLREFFQKAAAGGRHVLFTVDQ